MPEKNSEVLDMLERLVYGIQEKNLTIIKRDVYLLDCLKKGLGIKPELPDTFKFTVEKAYFDTDYEHGELLIRISDPHNHPKQHQELAKLLEDKYLYTDKTFKITVEIIE